jgi:hypoxanthine-DNA glycosylase
MYAAGFPPVADAGARVLVLGSLPGPVSLRERQYYAQPRNAFWRIMGVLFGAGPEQPYEARLEGLRSNHVALWDVCASAHRSGALDAAIRRASVVPNDFAAFFGEHSRLQLVVFNGQVAAELYRRKVVSGLPEKIRSLRYQTLPSTSPAYASMTFEQKLERWRVVREAGLSDATQR